MLVKPTIVKVAKTIISDTRQSIVGIIIGAVIVGAGGIFLFAKNLWHSILFIMQSPTPLWVTSLLILICALNIYLKNRYTSKKPPINEKLREHFGVYWNEQNKLRCLFCKHPLHPSSNRHDSSIFFCSNCNRKYSLRDQDGNHINEAQAISLLKDC